jgi:Spy/CpxP family protein refolding chaperone
MTKLRCLLFVAGLMFLGGAITGQEAKKEKESKPAAKAKGSQLPQNWSKLGLTDDQKSKVYAIDAKIDEEIDKLTAKIKELKEQKKKEQLDVLTAEQKKRLEDILKKAAGTDK